MRSLYYSIITFAKLTNHAYRLFTPHYRHLLNIRSTSAGESDEGELQRYKTVVDKKWGSFGMTGFSDIDSGKLEFDLTEGERNKIRAKHETLDWVRCLPSRDLCQFIPCSLLYTHI